MIPYRTLFTAGAGAFDPWWLRWRPTLRYLMETEAHVYALAIAASTLLAFFPFLVVTICLFRDVLHWPAAVDAVYLAIRDVFPGKSGGVVAQNLQSWMVPHLPVTSVVLLLVTSNGIFEPLEVALNRAWGVAANRSYWKNQLVSLGMVFACGGLVLLSLVFTAYNREWVAAWAGHGELATWLTLLLFKVAAVPVSILVLFLIYWLLPNCKVDPMQVAPVAIWVGLALELLKYLNILVRPWLAEKLDREYHMFQYSVTILLGSFVAALIVLAGAEFAARRGRDACATQGPDARFADSIPALNSSRVGQITQPN
ncbi:MAG: YihY/virulence factor BrkB family protein [Bryobacteraceae bacterium]